MGYDGEASSATHKQLSDGTGRSAAQQGNQMRVATATRFSFFFFFFCLGRHLVILAENRTSFRGNVAQQMRRIERKRRRERESAPC